MRGWMRVLGLALCAASAARAGDRWKDMIPAPKQAKVVGSDWRLPADAVIAADDFPMSKIAAEEVNKRLKEIAAPALRVVAPAEAAGAKFVIRLACAPLPADAARLAAAEGIKLSPNDPGKQGYVIRFIDRGGRRVILLAGCDPHGALYAAVSLCWLIEKGDAGPTVTPVNLRDWPDFKWRGSGSMLFVFSNALPPTTEGRIAAGKQFVDWCLQRKINVLYDYGYFVAGMLPKDPNPWIVETNRYAHARGFLTFVYQSTCLFDRRRGVKPDPEYVKNAAIVGHNRYFTWGDDAALTRRAREVAQFCARNGFNLLCLHPPDGGGATNPSMFFNRSALDRKRFSDDQRPEADANVYNIFIREARKLQPHIRIGLTVYPYSAAYLDYDRMKKIYPALTPETFKRNVTDYFARLAKLIPRDCHIVIREGAKKDLAKLRAYWDPRPVVHWCDFAGRWHRQPYFTTTYRYINSSYYGCDDDVLSCMQDRIRPNLVNYCGTAEYTWNIHAPGWEPYRWSHTDVLADAHRPKVMIEQFIPRACRNVWGPQAGPLMAPIFQSGLSAALLVRTATVLKYVNRPRRAKGLPDIAFTTAMAKDQAAAAARALPGVTRVVNERPAMNPYAFKAAVYYYRRVRLLSVIAQLRYHIMRGTDLADAKKPQEARREVEAGLALLKKELPALRRMAKETAKLPHFSRYFVHRRRDAYSVLLKYDVDFLRYRKALAALERRLDDWGKRLPVLPHRGVIRLGVYNPAADGGSAIGCKGALMTFQGQPGIKAEFITDLSLDNLVKYDCVIIPQCSLGQSSTRYDFFTGLRRYVVEAGGAAWFMHNSVGTPRSEFGMRTTFPEVARGSRTRVDSNRVRIVRHPITKGFKPGTIIEHSYYDHWILRRTKKAGRSVLLDEKLGAVWVAGQVGKGRVLYDGTIVLDKHNNETPAAGAYKKLMIAALKWLTQRP